MLVDFTHFLCVQNQIPSHINCHRCPFDIDSHFAHFAAHVDVEAWIFPNLAHEVVELWIFPSTPILIHITACLFNPWFFIPNSNHHVSGFHTFFMRPEPNSIPHDSVLLSIWHDFAHFAAHVDAKAWIYFPPHPSSTTAAHVGSHHRFLSQNPKTPPISSSTDANLTWILTFTTSQPM